MQMNSKISRRGFVKSSLVASAAVPLALSAQAAASVQETSAPRAIPAPVETLPSGRIGNIEFSRLMIGGNLISGWAHARDLGYVATLMRRYNTEARIQETLELAEAHGIDSINTYVMDNNSHIWNHWKRGGKMKWFAQVRLDVEGGYSQIQKAVDEGAAGVHVNGDAAEGMLARRQFDRVGEMVELIKSKKCLSGVAAHDLRVIVECVKARMEVDFYQKTLHSHDYYTAPRAGETRALGANDNSWCSDPQAVIDFMATVDKPWIAFKILAAGAIPTRTAFPYAFNSGADFILVGMFDWQIAENARFAQRVMASVTEPNSKRTRAWCAS
jgi:hypothetical protein